MGVNSPCGNPYGVLKGPSSSDSNVSSHRIVSGASTLEEEMNSTGGEKILFSREVTTGIFCSMLFSYLCSTVWPEGQIVLDWGEGRGETTLSWADT